MTQLRIRKTLRPTPGVHTYTCSLPKASRSSICIHIVSFQVSMYIRTCNPVADPRCALDDQLLLNSTLLTALDHSFCPSHHTSWYRCIAGQQATCSVQTEQKHTPTRDAFEDKDAFSQSHDSDKSRTKLTTPETRHYQAVHAKSS